MSVAGAATKATNNIGRNDPCSCGSGLKFKHCCQKRQGKATPAGASAPQAPRQRLQELFRQTKQHWDAGRFAAAIPLLQEIVRLDPNAAQAHHDLGITLLRCGRTTEAAASLQRAVELNAGSGRVLPHFAYALEREGRDREASAAYRRAAQLANDFIDRQHYQAKALVLDARLQEAEAELRSLLASAPDRVRSRYLLGHVLSQRGQFDEAVTLLTQAVEQAPEEPFAFEELTTAKRVTEVDRPLLERMLALAKRSDLDVLHRISLHYGLGKALDDLQQPGDAMRHYDEANRLRAMSVRLDRKAFVAQLDNLIAGFTREALERAAQSLARPVVAGDDLPVLIVGMPRSGTTLVEQVLSSHPAVGAAGELGFWKERLDGWHASRRGSVQADAMAEAAADYRALLRGVAPGALRVTDKAPDNFTRLWLIRLAFPDARIIHCRRNPVDTCLSIFFTHFQGRHDYAYDRHDLVFYYRQYQRLMAHWRQVLPADRFTEVDYEKLVTDREAETRRLVAFCGLEWDDACLVPERNTRVVATASRWQARQPVYTSSIERWRRYEPWLGELRELLSAAGAQPT